MHFLRAILIDDEISAINAMQMLIEKYVEQVKIIATATRPDQAIEAIENYKPDVVFLDISMPELSGFELLNKLSYRDFVLVFTTAHDEYALDAIKQHAFDYLLKPIDTDELKSCVSRILNEGDKTKDQKSHLNTVSISVKDGILFLKQSEIIRLEASGSYTTFYLDNNVKHVASKSLKEFEAQLNPDIFYRCHNSHLINLKKVVKFINHEGFYAQLTDYSNVEISRKNKDQFLELLKNVAS